MSRVRVNSRLAKGVYLSQSMSPGVFLLFVLPFMLIGGLIRLTFALTVIGLKLSFMLVKLAVVGSIWLASVSVTVLVFMAYVLGQIIVLLFHASSAARRSAQHVGIE